MLFATWAGAGTSACRRWVRIAESPVSTLDESHWGKELLVIMRSGDRLLLLPPVGVIGDNLRGHSWKAPEESRPASRAHAVLALDDIEEIRADQVDGGRCPPARAGCSTCSLTAASRSVSR